MFSSSPADYVHLSPSINGTQRRPSPRYLGLAEVEVFRKQAGTLKLPGRTYSARSLRKLPGLAFESTHRGTVGTISGTLRPLPSIDMERVRLMTGSYRDRSFGVEHIYYTDMRATVSAASFGTLRRVNKDRLRGHRAGRASNTCSRRSRKPKTVLRLGLFASIRRRRGSRSARQQSSAARNRLVAERLIVYVPNENFTERTLHTLRFRRVAACTISVL